MLIALKVLAYDLSGCEICGILLHLPHTIEILTCGLDSFMKVQCTLEYNTNFKRSYRNDAFRHTAFSGECTLNIFKYPHNQY